MSEHDTSQGEGREERRWMQRCNKNQCARIKKDESSRVQAFVELAYEHDPRVQKQKTEAARLKLEQKQAKEQKLREEREAREAVSEAARLVEAQQAQQADSERQVHRQLTRLSIFTGQG